jgi:hypothetical protein
MTEPSHSVVGVLRWAKAPAEVIAWAEREALGLRLVNTIEDELPALLDAAPSNRAVVWLLAALGVESQVLATAVGMLIESRLPQLEEPRLAHALEVSLDNLLDASLGDETLVQAKLCELLVEAQRAQTESGYRGHDGRYVAACRAMSVFARAAESIGAHGARMEGERLARARQTASFIGIGISAMVAHQPMVPASLARPLSVDTRPPHELVFASEHLALALTELEAFDRPNTLRDELLDHLADE